MAEKDRNRFSERFYRSFREAFLRVLLEKLPSWREYVAERAQDGPLIEITPPNWKGPPFTIAVRGDTVTVCPLCKFGFDYTSTATEADLAEAQRVFAKPISEIADFVAGRTVVAIKRNRFLFLKSGRSLRTGWQCAKRPRAGLFGRCLAQISGAMTARAPHLLTRANDQLRQTGRFPAKSYR
jgi:hypothetical protein